MGNQCDEARSESRLDVTGSTWLLRQVAPGSEGRREEWEARPGGGEDARRGGLGIAWGRRKSRSRLLAMSREMFGVVVGAFGDAIDGNGDGGGGYSLGVLLLAKGECKKASKLAAARQADGEGGTANKKPSCAENGAWSVWMENGDGGDRDARLARGNLVLSLAGGGAGRLTTGGRRRFRVLVTGWSREPDSAAF